MNWIFIIDEFALLFAATHWAMEGNSQRKLDEAQLCYRFLFGSIASHINGLLLMAGSGFDVQARVLARTFSEHVDIILLLLLDPSKCVEFQETSEPELSNAFWHKNISKGKLKKLVTAHILSDHPELDDALGDLRNYVQKEEATWSSALHPSYLAAVMACFTGASHGKGGPASVFGIVDTASVRTLKFIFYRLFELVMIGGEKLKYLIEKTRTDVPYTREELLDRLKFVRGMAIHVIVHERHLPLNGERMQGSEADA